MRRRDFLKFTAATGLLGVYPAISIAGDAKDNFILHNNLRDTTRTIIDEIFKTNEYYSKSKGTDFFETFKKSQQPRTTVIGCCDSRFQTISLDNTPENDMFVIRNIGNQFTSNEGSVEYGIHHLHTPLLLIVGHSRCGAIKAALSDYSDESSAIRREIDTLCLSVKKSKLYGSEEQKWLLAVIQNVKMQAEYAYRRFEDDVISGKLTILGVVFDLANDFKEGYGKLKIVSLNGDGDPERFMDNNLIRAITITRK